MNRLLARMLRKLGASHHPGECPGFPYCRTCLPAPTPAPPVEVRAATVEVLRRHGVDPFARSCVCGLDTTAYFDHVVAELTAAGVLRTDRDPS